MPSLVSLAAIPHGPGIGPMTSIISGQQQNTAAQAQATSLSQEATYATQYSYLEAAQNDYQTQRTMGTQDAQFGASGVSLAGSPLGILTETKQLGAQVSQSYIKQGGLQSSLYEEQGLHMLAQGSAAAFSGQAGAINDQYQYELQKAQAVDSAIGGALSFSASMGLGAASIAFGPH